MNFTPKRDVGLILLFSAALVAVAFTAITAWAALNVAIGPLALLLLILALVSLSVTLVIVIYVVSFWLLSYRVERNGVLISAGLFHLFVPMSAIQGIYAAPVEPSRRRTRALRFPGHNVGYQLTSWGGPIIYLATAMPEDCLYVVTAKRTYAISPAATGAFLRFYSQERALGPVRQWHESLRVAPVLPALVWRDYLGRSLAGGSLLVGLLLLALVFWRYPHLPAQIPLHFDPLGRPDRLGPPQQLFYLPFIGSVVTIINFTLAILLYRRERLLSYFLWGSVGVVQVLLIFALHSITG
ncbi:MAG: DUF1648 domain-containing protein [Anaerolineae bacterium]